MRITGKIDPWIITISHYIVGSYLNQIFSLDNKSNVFIVVKTCVRV